MRDPDREDFMADYGSRWSSDDEREWADADDRHGAADASEDDDEEGRA